MGSKMKNNYFLTSIVILPCILSGLETCYSSIALPQMNLTVAQASWFAAGPGLTAALGALVLGSVLELCGRKAALMSSSFCYLIGWTIIYLDSNFTVVILGRLFTGLPATFAAYAAQVYIVECVTVNDQHLSDSLRTWPTISFAFGQLLTFLLGAFLTYLQLTAFASILSLLLLVSMHFFVIESPAWLHQKGRFGDAEVATQKLRISQPILKSSPDRYEKEEQEEKPLPLGTSPYFDSNLWQILKKSSNKNVYKPALIMMGVCVLVMMTGGMALNSYMVNIIDGSQPGLVNTTSTTPQAGLPTGENSSPLTHLTNTNSFKYSVISGVLMVVGTILLGFVLPRWGARKLTIGSAVFMGVCMFLIGFSNGGRNSQDLLWLRLISVWLISFIFSLGIGTVPISILSAMFPPDAKCFGCLAIIMQVLAAFAVSQTFPFLYLLSKSGIFYGYASMCLCYAIFVYAFMPEIVGRNYEQISADF